MAKYNVQKMRTLVQLTSWLNKNELNASGFNKLANSIRKNEKSEGKMSPEIIGKYLENLWSECNSSIKNGTDSIGKNENHISEILRFCDFISWTDFEEDIQRITNKINSIELTPKSSVLPISVMASSEILTSLKPFLSFTSKILDTSLQEITLKDFTQEEIEDKKTQSSYLIWYLCSSSEVEIPNSYDGNPWKNFIVENGIIPVWSDATKLNIPGTSPPLMLFNIRSVLLSILQTSITLSSFSIKPVEVDTSKNKRITNHIGKIHNESGMVSLGNIKIKGKHIALGDFNQTNKKKEGK